jgi:hypothetical protein
MTSPEQESEQTQAAAAARYRPGDKPPCGHPGCAALAVVLMQPITLGGTCRPRCGEHSRGR